MMVRARDEAVDAEFHDAPASQLLWQARSTVNEVVGQPFDQRCFAGARFAHEQRVLDVVSNQNPLDAEEQTVCAHGWAKLSRVRLGCEVPSVLTQGSTQRRTDRGGRGVATGPRCGGHGNATQHFRPGTDSFREPLEDFTRILTRLLNVSEQKVHRQAMWIGQSCC